MLFLVHPIVYRYTSSNLSNEELYARKVKMAESVYPDEYNKARPTPFEVIFSGLPREISARIHLLRDPSDFEPCQIDRILGYREGRTVKNTLLDSIIDTSFHTTTTILQYLDSRWVADLHVWKAIVYFFPWMGHEFIYQHLFTDMDCSWLRMARVAGSNAHDLEMERLSDQHYEREQRVRMIEEWMVLYPLIETFDALPMNFHRSPI